MRLAGWGGGGPLVLSRCHATSRLSPTSLLRCRGNREENPSHSHCRSSSVDAAGTRGSCGAGLQTSPSATAAVAARLNLHAMAGDWFERERNGNRGRIGFGRFGLGYGGNDGVPTRRSCISKEGTTAGSGDGGGVGRGVATGSGRWRRSAFGLEGLFKLLPVASSAQVANGLTNALPISQFQMFTSKLGTQDLHAPIYKGVLGDDMRSKQKDEQG
nr:uncharacterized protein LOC109166828 [Ipomoea batatas]